MSEKEINIRFHEYSSLDELDKADRELAEAAIDAMKGSYAPYSHFNVGVAPNARQCSPQEPHGPTRPWYR